MALFNEPNIQWYKINTYDNWYERSHEALGRQNYKWAHNRHDHHNPHIKQIGGMRIVARLATHPRVVDKGEDTQAWKMDMDENRRTPLALYKGTRSISPSQEHKIPGNSI